MKMLRRIGSSLGLLIVIVSSQECEFFADGGWQDTPRCCKNSWSFQLGTIVIPFNTPCLSIQFSEESDLLPFGFGDSAVSLLNPTNPNTDTAQWCSLADIYNPNEEETQTSWGFCLHKNNTTTTAPSILVSPSISPTKNPTSSPTKNPTSSPTEPVDTESPHTGSAKNNNKKNNAVTIVLPVLAGIFVLCLLFYIFIVCRDNSSNKKDKTISDSDIIVSDLIIPSDYKVTLVKKKGKKDVIQVELPASVVSVIVNEDDNIKYH